MWRSTTQPLHENGLNLASGVFAGLYLIVNAIVFVFISKLVPRQRTMKPLLSMKVRSRNE